MPASDIGFRPKVTAGVVDLNSPPSGPRPSSPRKPALTLNPASMRPRARVSATATIQARRPSASSSVVSSPSARPQSTVSQFPPRATSPFKPKSIPSSAVSPTGTTTTTKPRVLIRSPPTVTTAKPETASKRGSPEQGIQSPFTRHNDQIPAGRPHTASLALRHVPSLSSLGGLKTPVTRNAPSLAGPRGSPAPASAVSSPLGLAPPAPMRITSKVTNSAKKGPYNSNMPASTPSSPVPTDAMSRPAPGSLRIRAPSAMKRPSQSLDSPTGFSSVSQSPSLPTFPLPDATSSPRPIQASLQRRLDSPTGSRNSHQTHRSEDLTISLKEALPSRVRSSISAKFDPSQIPLPLASPPVSSVSFSSRSSVSSWTAGSLDDSGGTAATSYLSQPPIVPPKLTAQPTLEPPSTPPKAHVDMNGLLMMLDVDVIRGNSDIDVMPGTSQTQAKSNRKIADLEISNRSLLAINSTLEATKHRQAKELREIRRRLRESRLSLPPRAFQALQEQDGKIVDEAEDDQDEEAENEEQEEEEEEETAEGAKGEADMTYWRVRSLISSLLDSGKRALEVKPKDLVPVEGSKGAAKVLSAQEVRDWRRDSDVVLGDEDMLGGDLSMVSGSPSSAFGGDETEAGDTSITDDGDVAADMSEDEDEDEEVDKSVFLKGLNRQNPVRSRRQSPTPPIIISGH